MANHTPDYVGGGTKGMAKRAYQKRQAAEALAARNANQAAARALAADAYGAMVKLAMSRTAAQA